MKLSEATYTTFDLETTGLFAASGDAICEIGALRHDPIGNEAIFEQLVDPQRPISPGAYKMNQISEEMLCAQPLIDDVLPGFMDFIAGSVLLAYNARFDISFLSAALGDRKTMLNDFLVIDVLELARMCFMVPGGYSLGNVAYHFGIEQDIKHRALPDVISTWKIFNRAIPVLKEKGIENVEEVARVYTQTPGTFTVPGASISQALSEAIKTKSQVKIRYRSSWKVKVTERTITPLSIKGEYVYSFCHLRKELRTFLIDCIEIVG